jgi:hypothetical protein
MKKILQIAVLVLCVSSVARGQQKLPLTASATTCTTTNTACLIYGIDSTNGGATFTIGSNSGNTVQFEASGDAGATWVALSVTPSNSTTTVTSTTGTGTWQANVAGYTTVRMRCSTFVSGSAVVSIITSLASARAGGGGGGGGTVTAVTGTGPIVSSGGATPAISCPTCNTSGATIAGTVTTFHIPYASASNTLSDTIGSAVTGATGAIALTAGADTTTQLSLAAHSATQSASQLDINASSAGSATGVPFAVRGKGTGSWTPAGGTMLVEFLEDSSGTEPVGWAVRNLNAVGSSGVLSGISAFVDDNGVSSITGGNAVGDSNGLYANVTFAANPSLYGAASVAGGLGITIEANGRSNQIPLTIWSATQSVGSSNGDMLDITRGTTPGFPLAGFDTCGTASTAATCKLFFAGTTSGKATISAAAVAGTPCTFLLPTVSPTAGIFLNTAAPSSGACQTVWDTLLVDSGSTLSYSGANGISTTSDGVHAGQISLVGNTTNPAVPANTAGIVGPALASFTAYSLQLPSTGPTNALPLLSCATPASSVSACTFVANSGLAPAFNTITSGTNTTAAMVVGTGASLKSTPEFDIGAVGTNGVLGLNGTTSGTAKFTAPAVAGTSTNGVTMTNVLLGPLGAVGTPTYSSSTNAGDGMWFRSSGTVDISTNGSAQEDFAGGGTIKASSTGVWAFASGDPSITGPDTGISRISAGVVGVGNGTAANVTGTIEPGKYATGTNCSSSAAPAVCGSAAAGSVVVAAAGTTVTVNTTAVTANSQIFVMYDSSLGTKLSVTCNATEPALYGVTARTGGTSFTITATSPVTNPACFSFFIVN